MVFMITSRIMISWPRSIFFNFTYVFFLHYFSLPPVFPRSLHFLIDVWPLFLWLLLYMYIETSKIYNYNLLSPFSIVYMCTHIYMYICIHIHIHMCVCMHMFLGLIIWHRITSSGTCAWERLKIELKWTFMQSATKKSFLLHMVFLLFKQGMSINFLMF